MLRVMFDNIEDFYAELEYGEIKSPLRIAEVKRYVQEESPNPIQTPQGPQIAIVTVLVKSVLVTGASDTCIFVMNESVGAARNEQEAEKLDTDITNYIAKIIEQLTEKGFEVRRGQFLT